MTTKNLENILSKSSPNIFTQSEEEKNETLLYHYPRRDSEDIPIYLERVKEIIRIGAFDTAIASAIFTLETIMPLIAEENDIDFETKNPTELLQVFDRKNLLDRETCEILTQAIALRDAFMQKQEIECDRAFAEGIFAIVNNLFRGLGNPNTNST